MTSDKTQLKVSAWIFIFKFLCIVGFFFFALPCTLWGFPGGSDGKDSDCNSGGLDSTSGSGEGHGSPLQCSCLENPMDRSLAGCSSWGGKESDTTEQLRHMRLVGSWSLLTRVEPCAPCSGSTEFHPLDHQGSPSAWILKKAITAQLY